MLATTERTPARVNKTVNRLKLKIVQRSSGLIPEETAENLAFRCVARMDFNNPIQMHRSLESFADGIIASYFRSLGME